MTSAGNGCLRIEVIGGVSAMLGDPQAHIRLFPLFRSVSRDGCTRLGSPGIFWVPPCYSSSSAAYLQLASISRAGMLSGEFSPVLKQERAT